MTIQIHTRLDAGIYRSCGGGQDVVRYEWRVGPRNLLWAVETLRRHRRNLLRWYGNVGAGASWITIDGQRVPDPHLDEIAQARVDRATADEWAPRPPTATEVARQVLAEVALRTD